LRKLAAILLCGIFFFNWVGYRFVDTIMEGDAARRLDARLDRQQYNEDQLITIKIPVSNLSYYNNSASFERANGQIDINGVPYRYVKRRIYHDSLEMLCIPDQAALKVRQSDVNYFDGMNDIEHQQGSASGAHPNIHKSFQSDPYIEMGQIGIHAPAVAVALKGESSAAALSSLSLPTDERPPAVIG
jgi:hypothetical protein